MAKRSQCNSSYEFLYGSEKTKFCDWFWTGTNGNELINALNMNNSKSSGSKLRRRRSCWPHIYCVVLNDDENPGTFDGIQWKYCKVGITERDTSPNAENRMETIQHEIEKIGKTGDIKFVLPVKATDSRPNNAIEKTVRECTGYRVDKDLAKVNKFPVSTEWVITTEDHITNIRRVINNKKKNKESMDTGLFQEVEKLFSQHNQPEEQALLDRAKESVKPSLKKHVT